MTAQNPPKKKIESPSLTHLFERGLIFHLEIFMYILPCNYSGMRSATLFGFFAGILSVI